MLFDILFLNVVHREGGIGRFTMSAIHQELENRTVVVVDDDIDLAESVKDQLVSVGMKVVGVANDGPSALKMIDDLDPSIVILDIKMPDMDGIQVAETLIKMEPRPILFMSAYSDISYVRRAAKIGVFTYLVKPVSVDNLVPSIILTINRFRETISLKAAVDSMNEEKANSDIIEKARDILMQKHSISANQAYESIQRRSIDENKPVASIAENIVASELKH